MSDIFFPLIADKIFGELQRTRRGPRDARIFGTSEELLPSGVPRATSESREDVGDEMTKFYGTQPNRPFGYVGGQQRCV